MKCANKECNRDIGNMKSYKYTDKNKRTFYFCGDGKKCMHKFIKEKKI